MLLCSAQRQSSRGMVQTSYGWRSAGGRAGSGGGDGGGFGGIGKGGGNGGGVGATGGGRQTSSAPVVASIRYQSSEGELLVVFPGPSLAYVAT